MEETITITADELDAECLMRRYAELLKKPDVFPSKNNWNYITEHRMHRLSGLLYQKYADSENTPEKERGEFHQTALESFPAYLEKIGYTHAVETIFDESHRDKINLAVNLAVKLNLFNARGISRMLQTGHIRAAARMLAADQPEYTVEDLREMRLLLAQFANLPELGSMEKPILGLLGGQGKYICPNGHSNKADAEFCTQPGCRLNIKGLSPEEVECITAFADRIETLESMIRSRRQADRSERRPQQDGTDRGFLSEHSQKAITNI